MPIDVLCPGCGKTLRLADAHAGKTGRCPNCQAHFQIPTLATSAEENKPEVNAGFDQLVSQLQPQPSRPSAQNPPTPAVERKALFGENQAAQSAQNPFADTPVPKPDYSNPYAAPQATAYVQSPAASNPGNDAAIPIVLGIVSMGFAVMGLCCCITNIASLPMCIVGLVLTFRLPKEHRTFPLVLNILALIMSFGWLFFQLAFFGLQMMNGPQFRP